jgi:hypothetical protein
MATRRRPTSRPPIAWINPSKATTEMATHVVRGALLESSCEGEILAE